MEFTSNLNIDFIVITTTIMIRWLPNERDYHFWKPLEYEKLANLDFKTLNHLKNLK